MAVFSFADAVACNEELVCVPSAQHFYPHQDRSYNDGMNAINTDGIDGMEIRQRLAIFPAEGYVVAHLSDSPARFHSPDHVAMRQMLVLQAHFRPSKDSNLP
jgi:hypothetical protein